MKAAVGTSLNAARRERELASLDAPGAVDVLVVGGGVTGAGVALDAASRGLSVILAERHDLAFGTSRWSSKLVHGGLRYLASGAVGLAYESAFERNILLCHTAPHLVRPMPQVLPLLPEVSRAGAAVVRSGLAAGDLLRAAVRTPRRKLPRSRRVGAAEVLRLAPQVRADDLRGGLLSWDGQLQDDARLVVAIARTAAAHGARILTRCSATEVTGAGAVLRDELSGAGFQVDARMVINAAGVWAGQVAPGIALRPSRGTHLVVARERLRGMTAGLTVPVPGETNRFVFALPSPEGYVYIGLTDEETHGEIPDVPEASEGEIDFLLDTINSALDDQLSRDDLLGTFSGLRPLLDSGGRRTADVSRKHAVIAAPDGLTTVVGGKLTTYRRMAEDAVDAALGHAAIVAAPCVTRRLPLVGAASPAEPAPPGAPRHIVDRYGAEAPAVVERVGGDPELLRPIVAGVETTMAELIFAVEHEGALDESDLLDRRTRVGLDDDARRRALPSARAALDAAAEIADRAEEPV